jgi:hypothetical protein
VEDPVLQQRFASGYEEPAAVEERLGRVLRADTQEMPAVPPSAEHPSWELLIEGGAASAPPAATPQGATLDLTAHVGAGPVLVGRDPGCAIVLADPTVSRRHAELEVGDDACHVRDLGSRNGTYAHGRPVTSTRLHDGDTVTFGLHAVQLVWG